MQTPQVRPGLVSTAEGMPRVVVFFPNSALGNLAIQLLTQIGIPTTASASLLPNRSKVGRAWSSRSAVPTTRWSRKSRHSAAGKEEGFTAALLTALLMQQPARISAMNERHASATNFQRLLRRRFAGRWFARVLRAGLARRRPRADVPSYAKDVPTVRTGEPVLQFNGKDLTGFYSYLHDSKYDDPKKVFTVKDGVLVISGEDFGGLTTREEFRDYVLIVEWKWGERTFGSRKRNARDSGLLLHCVGPDGAAGGYWMESQECQIIEGGCGDFIMVGQMATSPA